MKIIIPPEAEKVLLAVKALFAESLVAVYLHGSAVSSGLRAHSDVDFIVVVDRPMTSVSRRCLADELMAISGLYPVDAEGRRPVEVMVFLRSDLIALRYPARCEFIYGEWLREEYEAGDIPESVYDAEFTLVLSQAWEEAVALFGSDFSALLPPIPKPDIHQAMRDILPALIDSLAGDERNVLLTLARMWRTAVMGDFVPKDIAASWAAEQLAAEQAEVLLNARENYLNGGNEDWESQQSELKTTVNTLRGHILANL